MEDLIQQGRMCICVCESVCVDCNNGKLFSYVTWCVCEGETDPVEHQSSADRPVRGLKDHRQEPAHCPVAEGIILQN